MGGLFSKKTKTKICILGLDNSGKTTIINRLVNSKTNNFEETVPTIGYNLETFQKNNITFNVFDMSGQDTYRDLWPDYCKDAQGIIFVIDAADRFRFSVVRSELQALLEIPEIKRKKLPILFFCNKMDLNEAATPEECQQQLNLQQISDRSWTIQASQARQGSGISEGLNWLSSQIK